MLVTDFHGRNYTFKILQLHGVLRKFPPLFKIISFPADVANPLICYTAVVYIFQFFLTLQLS